MITSDVPAARELPPHVLLADDDDDFSALLRDALDDRGYRVTRVSDGVSLQRALITSEMASGKERFDVILTDVYMPHINGLEALSAVPLEALPPVVLMTAFGSQETHETAYRLGVRVVINKPFDLVDFCTVIECLVGPAGPAELEPVKPRLRSLDELCRGESIAIFPKGTASSN